MMLKWLKFLTFSCLWLLLSNKLPRKEKNERSWKVTPSTHSAQKKLWRLIKRDRFHKKTIQTGKMLEGNSRLQKEIGKFHMTEIRVASAIIDRSSRLRKQFQEKWRKKLLRREDEIDYFCWNYFQRLFSQDVIHA